MFTKLFAETVCTDDNCDFFLKWSDGSDFVHDPGIDSERQKYLIQLSKYGPLHGSKFWAKLAKLI